MTRPLTFEEARAEAIELAESEGPILFEDHGPRGWTWMEAYPSEGYHLRWTDGLDGEPASSFSVPRQFFYWWRDLYRAPAMRVDSAPCGQMSRSTAGSYAP